MTVQTELPYWLALRRAGLGSVSFSRLLASFSTIEAAWDAAPAELQHAGLDPQYARAVAKARSTFDGGAEIEALERSGCRALTWLHDDYPPLLAEIIDSPPVIFVRGTANPAQELAVAIVGTRTPTPYGRAACERFASALADVGATIVSGLARGIDALAHRTALERGTPTVAVLGGGIDMVYPREHVRLADQIADAGCLVSEYPPGSRSRASHFPRRNRILAGLSRATLVVEAGKTSGALHTANWAREQDREVFAIPGNVDSKQSLGTNQLIREATAKLVATPEQLCEELNLLTAGQQLPLAPSAATGTPTPTSARAEPATAEEGTILHWLEDGPAHVDDVVRRSGLPPGTVSSTLQMLELKGLVRESSPLTYARSP